MRVHAVVWSLSLVIGTLTAGTRETPPLASRPVAEPAQPVTQASRPRTPTLEHAGFRVYYQLAPDRPDVQVAVVLGRSHVCCVGADHAYGVWPRGVAIDAGLDTAGGIDDDVVWPLPDDHRWRVAFRPTPDAVRRADMALSPERGGRRPTETWSDVWYGDPGR